LLAPVNFTYADLEYFRDSGKTDFLQRKPGLDPVTLPNFSYLMVILNFKAGETPGRDTLESMDLDQIYYGYGDYFIRLLMVAHKRGYNMLEVPVFYRLRMHGHSKTQFLSTFVQYSRALLALRLKLWTGRMR